MTTSSGYQVKTDTVPNRTVFVLLFVIPILVTAVYGGTQMWALILIAPIVTTMCGIWLISSIRRGELRFEADPTLIALSSLLGLSLIQLLPLGSVSAPGLNTALSHSLSFDPFATRIFAARLFFYVLFYAAALALIDSQRRIELAATVLAVAGGVIAFGGILQKLASPDAIYGINRPENAIPFGPFINQHHFASLMVMLSGPVLAAIAGRSVSRQAKLLLGISAVMMAAAVLLTGSRGGVTSYLAMMVVVALFYLLNERKQGSRKPVLMVSAGAVCLLLIAAIVLMLGGAESLFRAIGFQNTSDDISSGRLYFWSIAWKIFTHHPVLGAGMDAFGAAFTAFDMRNGMFRVEQAHNDYLQILADGGIAGLAILVCFIVFLLRGSLRRIRESSGTSIADVRIGAFAACIGIMVHSFVDFPLRTAGNAFFFLLTAALALAPIRTHKDHRT